MSIKKLLGPASLLLMVCVVSMVIGGILNSFSILFLFIGAGIYVSLSLLIISLIGYLLRPREIFGIFGWISSFFIGMEGLLFGLQKAIDDAMFYTNLQSIFGNIGWGTGIIFAVGIITLKSINQKSTIPLGITMILFFCTKFLSNIRLPIFDTISLLQFAFILIIPILCLYISKEKQHANQ